MRRIKNKVYSGVELRDRSWSLINRAHLDYSPKFIGLTEENNCAHAIDGLIRTPMGYYRLAEDIRDSTRILLHSYERDQLTGIEKDGEVILGEDSSDVYGVTARVDVRGTIFRDDMNHDIRYLEKCFQKDLNLHAEEIIIPSDKPEEPDKRVIRLANGHIAFSIYERDDGKWNVRLYNNLRKKDKASRFVKVTLEPKNGLKEKIFSTGRNIQECNSYEEAFKYVRKFWKTESTRLFKGLKSIADPSRTSRWQSVKARLLSNVLHITDNKLWRDWRIAIPVAVAVGFVSSLTATPLFGALIGLGAGFSWAILGKSIEAILTVIEKEKMEASDRQQLDALRPYFEQNVIRNYLKHGKTNDRRFRKKLDPKITSHLRLLNLDDANMNYDDGPIAPPESNLTDYEQLSSSTYHYFGAQFDATYAEQGVLVGIFPNGLISVVQVDKGTRTTHSYLMYNDRFNAFEKSANKKHLDPKLTRLPTNGPIHKISHKQGKDFHYVPMDGQEFMADLMAKIGPEAKDFRVFGFKIANLFNVEETGGVAEGEDLSVAERAGRDKPPHY